MNANRGFLPGSCGTAARQEAACVRSNRISPWSQSGDLDVAELGLLNIAFTQRKRHFVTSDEVGGPPAYSEN
jgi:hypothetical protein